LFRILGAGPRRSYVLPRHMETSGDARPTFAAGLSLKLALFLRCTLVFGPIGRKLGLFDIFGAEYGRSWVLARHPEASGDARPTLGCQSRAELALFRRIVWLQAPASPDISQPGGRCFHRAFPSGPRTGTWHVQFSIGRSLSDTLRCSVTHVPSYQGRPRSQAESGLGGCRGPPATCRTCPYR